VIAVRRAETDADYELWAQIKTVVVPNEPTTAEQLRRLDSEPGRLMLLADVDGETVGCGVAGRSSFGGRAFIAVRVVARARRRGVGTALAEALIDHARALDVTGVNAFVDAADEDGLRFVRRYGLEEVDYQLEQVRAVRDEPPPDVPAGIVLVALDGRREELLRAAWPIAEAGYADMPTPQPMEVPLAEWLRDEATLPDGSYVAFEDNEIVGYAGLMERAEAGTAEHGFTVVRRDRRGRGIARALKQAEIHWASRNGIHTLVTWTQRGNESMQGLNRRLGYVDCDRAITFQGPLP
jgi:GNAT superfamily N-acetyltransferase